MTLFLEKNLIQNKKSMEHEATISATNLMEFIVLHISGFDVYARSGLVKGAPSLSKSPSLGEAEMWDLLESLEELKYLSMWPRLPRPDTTPLQRAS